MKRIGFLINPVAGIGGQAGMKGSDDRAGREDALRRRPDGPGSAWRVLQRR